MHTPKGTITLGGKVFSNVHYHCEQVMGKFKLLGLKLGNERKYRLVVFDTFENTLVGTYKTKMSAEDQVEMLINRIKEDRENRIYLSFGIYSRAWVSKVTNKLHVPVTGTKLVH